ncbi:hypothetical protein FNF27_02796 [Cafeteria roenbergensis]|uniref:Uncharacterized protein n=1 Tax=Cafeteria roenbergensis TaxID=33653 RepID=A0A5A8CLL6_CAFRO|nr:hypothetical protein FNF29_03171 [Cafeteria roenbergensis]KAA0156922.1 hypothetical protein FNF31_05845 [Cafeteria roenbergensis]KAA0170917.1 hypothetical protein FNF28_01190 [Cafeteria roenbergensis]KAA0175710.1 hypothetical protein FNF27_02796 [Cafeteria roenbergensis]|eukprot:KAA0153354.1 hypothetical protein FNF29_03171 [Cafeteria roenbergensis]
MCIRGKWPSTAAGALVGALISWITNSTLMEISINSFFAFYFGFLFLFIGGALLWRVGSVLRATSSSSATQLYVFGGLVVASGLSCFLLDEHLFRFSPIVKIPLYVMLGTSVTFAFAFSIVDLMNVITSAFGGSCPAALSCCMSRASRGQVGLVETAGQINLLLFVSAFLGCVFGFVFGLLDIEDKRGAELRHVLLAEELYFCYPIGVLAGALTGWVNNKLREDEEEKLRRFRKGTQGPGMDPGAAMGFDDGEGGIFEPTDDFDITGGTDA